jgi:guanylate kinase
MTGHIFIITGPSGVGKGSLCSLLLQAEPNLSLSVSATSRLPRDGEVDGVNYYFKTRDEFQAMIDHDRDEPDLTRHHLLEWAEYNANFYGTPRAVVDAALQDGKHVLLEIEVQGAMQIKEKFPQACQIFIAPPGMVELERRLRHRGTEDEENIQNRLNLAHQELALQDRFDYVVVNFELEECAQEIRQIMHAHPSLESCQSPANSSTS